MKIYAIALMGVNAYEAGFICKLKLKLLMFSLALHP